MASSQSSRGKQSLQNSFKCEVCSVVFMHKNILRKHLASLHLDPYFYKCLRCKDFYLSGPEIQEHLQTKHNGDKGPEIIRNDILCELCSMRFPSRSELERHVIQRHAELQCPACQQDKHFVTMESLKSHFISKHGESLWGSYVRTTYKETYHRVLKLKVDPHTGEYSCCICNRHYCPRRKKLFRHVIEHLDLYPYRCPECPYTSSTRQNALSHYERMHPKSNSKHKIVNGFARWNHELGITARDGRIVKKLYRDSFTPKRTGLQKAILPSQHAVVQNMANRETSQGCELDFEELKDREDYSMELETNEVLPEDDKKRAKVNSDKKTPHDTEIAYFCCICDSQFTYIEFYKHTLKHENRAAYRCSSCSHTSIGLTQIRRHVKLKHETQGKLSIQLVPVDLSCKTCDGLRANKEKLQTHISRAHDVRLHCPLCEDLFGNLPLLREHLKLDHGTKMCVSHVAAVCKELREKVCYLKPDPFNKFSCFYCKASFPLRGGLFLHLRYVHLKFQSETLKNKRKGLGKNNRKKNKTTTSESSSCKNTTRFACYICTRRRYGTKARLLEHLHKHHESTISLPYFCKSCGEFCAHSNSMEVHWYENHGESEARYTRIPRSVHFSVAVITNFPCRYCIIYLSTETDRQRHESENHTENYKCSGCNFACEKIDITKMHINVVHAKSEPKPSIVRGKLLPDPTSVKGLNTQISSNSANEEAFLNPSLLANHHDIEENSVKMETDDSDLLNFEYVNCEPISEKPLTEKDSLIEPPSNSGPGLQIPTTLVRGNQNYVILPKSPGLNSELTESNSSPRAQEGTDRTCQSAGSNPRPEKSSTAPTIEQKKGKQSSSNPTGKSSTSHSPLVVEVNMNASKAFITYPPLQKISDLRTYKHRNRVVILSPLADTKPTCPMVEDKKTILPLRAQIDMPSPSYDSVTHSEVCSSSFVSSDPEVRTGLGNLDMGINIVPVALTSAAASNSEDIHNTTNQSFNIKDEMEFEDTVIKEEPFDPEDPTSTEDSITNPIAPFQHVALPSLTEIKHFNPTALDLQVKQEQSKALPECIQVSCVKTEEPILHQRSQVESHVKIYKALPAKTEEEVSSQEELAITEAQLRVRETVKDTFYKAYPCYLCTKMLSTQFLLIRHVVGAHLKVRLYECAYCTERCFRECDVRTHCVRAHPGQPAHVVTRFALDMFPRQADMRMESRRPAKKRRRRAMQSRNVKNQTKSGGDMSLDGRAVRAMNNSPASKIVEWNTSQCSNRTTTDVDAAKVKAVPIPGTSSTRRFTSRPYPDSLPPVPGGCLPCSVQLTC